MTVIYDKAKYHFEGDFPKQLSINQAYVHTGMFFGWIIDHDLYSYEFEEEAKFEMEEFKNRRMTGTDVYKSWDGVLADDMLNDEGNAFAREYFDFSTGLFPHDYEKAFPEIKTIYHVNDTWENYFKLREIIDKRYLEWKSKQQNASILIEKPVSVKNETAQASKEKQSKSSKKEQNAFKKLIQKELNVSMRKLTKEFGFKFKDGSLFNKVGDFFVHGQHFTSIKNNEFFISIYCYIKPYSYDNLFWEICDMENNKNEPMSLRAVGAFKCPSFKMNEIIVGPIQIDNIESNCRLVFQKFVIQYENLIANLDNSVERFNKMILKEESKHSYDSSLKLRKLLAEIQLGLLDEALISAQTSINEGQTGGFESGGKDILEYVVEYCKPRLNM